jgi:hypothetical protein
MQIKFVSITAAAACAVASPAAAQRMTVTATPMFAIGMQVTDGSGAPVGTVTGMDANNLRVKTDKHEVMLPKSGFTPGFGKLALGMTQAQLDAQAEQAATASIAAIAAGAAVKGNDGAPVGKVDSVADGNVVVALDSGARVAIPQNGARANPDGTVTIGYSAAQIATLTAAPATAAPTTH